MNLSIALKVTTEGNPKIATSEFPITGTSEKLMEELVWNASIFLAQYESDIGSKKDVKERTKELFRKFFNN